MDLAEDPLPRDRLQQRLSCRLDQRSLSVDVQVQGSRIEFAQLNLAMAGIHQMRPYPFVSYRSDCMLQRANMAYTFRWRNASLKRMPVLVPSWKGLRAPKGARRKGPHRPGNVSIIQQFQRKALAF